MWEWRDEWAFVKSAIHEFEPFLFSNEIYWPLSFMREDNISPRFNPRLSAGRVEISIYLLEFYSSNDPQIQSTVAEGLARIQALKNQWKSNWSKKAALEFDVRLRQWQRVVREIRSHSISNAEYKNEVQVRLMLSFLEESAGDLQQTEEKSGLTALDQVLKVNSISSLFIWSKEIKDAFPSERFWFLYRTLE